MIRGLDSAASGLFAGQRRQEALTNNLINAETPGYKSEEAVLRSFPEMLMERMREGENGKRMIGGMQNGVYTHELVPDWRTGDPETTENPFDFAITRDPVNAAGERAVLFFTVMDPEQNLHYTRNGRFIQNAEGQLATADGYLVLDDQGNPIPINGQIPELTEGGILLLRDPLTGDINNEVRLGLVAFGLNTPTVPAPNNFPNVNLLMKGANGTYALPPGAAVQPVGVNNPALMNFQYEIKQGVAERANVDITKTMTELMEVLRYYEANQRSLLTADRTLDKAVNEIGRV